MTLFQHDNIFHFLDSSIAFFYVDVLMAHIVFGAVGIRKLLPIFLENAWCRNGFRG